MKTNMPVMTENFQSGNYNLPNDFKQKELIRGSIEYALEVLKMQYKTPPLRAVPYNKTFDYTNYGIFNLYDCINGGPLSSTPCKYVFYGDVVVNAFDNENGVAETLLACVVFDNMSLPTSGLRYVAYDKSTIGGATQLRSSAINNAFVNYIQIGNLTPVEHTLYATIKLEGHLIQLY